MNREPPTPPRRVEPACPTPCAACPWRTENHGKPHPDGWYTLKNRKRLWAQLRRGESMTCHPTDPLNPVPDGGRVVPEDVTTHECAGALLLQERELMKLQAPSGPFRPLDVYRRGHPHGLTVAGAAYLAQRAVFGGVPLLGAGIAMTRLDLNQPVSHPPLGDWDAWVAAHPPKED